MRRLRLSFALLLISAAPYFLISPFAHAATASAKKKTAKKRYRIPKAPRVSAQVRAQASEKVSAMLDRTAGIAVENPAAMVPFFEQLLRAANDEATGPLSILHYGDSHTAADDLTGSVRALLQERFGDGGGGYSLAGK